MRYAGTCVGGPRAGMQFQHHSPVADFAVDPRVSEHPLNQTEAASVKFDTRQYIYDAVTTVEGDVLHFWRWSGMTSRVAMAEVFKAYVDAQFTKQPRE